MKILFVTRGYPSEKDLMAGNYEAVQAKAIAAKGHEVSVISVYERPFWSFPCWRSIMHRTDGNINVYEGWYPSFSIRFIRRVNKYYRKSVYRLAFEKYREVQGMPEIVHAHIISTASFAIFYKEEYHLPYIITEHWSKAFAVNTPIWLKRMSSAYGQADQVICVSHALSESLKQKFQVNSIVIYNMVSDQFFKSPKIERDDKSFRFIAIGSLRKVKGYDILVDAFAKGDFHKNVTLDIVGDGEEQKAIEERIKQYGLSGKVHLLGTKTPEEVSELLSYSDCLVLSSRIETFAIVIIEAMAKGLPVIATKCGGPDTFLRPEHGMLVEKENVDQLTDAMKQMIEKYSNYDGEKIKKYCHDNFSQDAIADKIIDVYKQVLSKKTQNIVNSER